MNVFSLDYYRLLKAGEVIENAGWGVRSFDFGFGARLLGWSGQISSFPKLHVDTWLSLDQPSSKEGNGVFGMVKCGDSGRGGASMENIDVWISGLGYLNFWAHNMLRSPCDFHCSYEIYYG